MAEESVESREERAKNSTSPEELEKLAEDEDYYVRTAVSENTNKHASNKSKRNSIAIRVLSRGVCQKTKTHT